jgi:hypothetical protein
MLKISTLRASHVGRIRCVAGHSQYSQYGVMARRLAAAAGAAREMSGIGVPIFDSARETR